MADDHHDAKQVCWPAGRRAMRTLAKALAVLVTAAPLAARAAPLPSWADQMEALKPVGEALLAESGRGDAEARRQEMYSYVLGALSDGYLNYVSADPARPTWTPLWNHGFNYGGANPDYAYMLAWVDPKGVYRISGYRGTSRFVEITQTFTDFIRPPPPGMKTQESNDLDSLHIGKDGYFSVILSAERPVGYTGDWWRLDPTTVSLLMRKTSADWRHEIDPRIAIDRLDPAPPLTPEERARRFSDLKDWIATRITSEMRLARYYREHHGINTIKKSELRAADSGRWTQVYLDGAFQIADDEALILETSVPAKCRYWQILLADDRFTTIDWVNRQSSLNDYQARLDKDGKFRAVIAAGDPGVPNWLDTASERWGVIQMRWNRCSENPTPEVRKVALKDVRKFLPADTPVVTPEQRKAQLHERREAAQLRQLW
jgi:hypothetical protein